MGERATAERSAAGDDAGAGRRGFLHVVVTASIAAQDVHVLVRHALDDGWGVGVVATPDAVRLLGPDRVAELERMTGWPVVSDFRPYQERPELPNADAVVVAPLTSKSLNRWALQAGDSLVGSYLNELPGLGKPVVAMPYVSAALAQHPRHRLAIRALRRMGIVVLEGPAVSPPNESGPDPQRLATFPWRLALRRLDSEIARRERAGWREAVHSPWRRRMGPPPGRQWSRPL